MCSGDSSVKNATIALIFILCSLALVIALGHTSIFKMYDNKTLDSRFYWRHRLLDLPAPSDIRIIGIDDQSLLALGNRWPLSWKWHVLLLEALSERLPAVVAYDILFQSPSTEATPDEDKLVHATRTLGDVVVPFYLNFEEAGFSGPSIYKTAEALATEKKILRKSRITHVTGDRASLPHTIEATLPDRAIAEIAALGFANARGDEEDGVVRRIPLVLPFEGDIYPSFSLMAVIRYYNVDLEDVRVRIGDCVEFTCPEGGTVSIPIDEQGRMLINYTAKHNEFKNNLFVQVVQSFARQQKGLETTVDLSDFEGKIVLVGLTASGVVEAHIQPTPLSTKSPLLTVHANAIETILSASSPRPLGSWTTAVLFIFLGAVTATITFSMKAAKSLALAVICLCMYILLCYTVFFESIIILPLIPGAAMVVLVYTLITSYRYATEERQRRFYRSVLGKYLSRNVMEAILENPSDLRLGGQRKELTVLFADVRGFSKFCEESAVDQIAPRLNELHDRLTRTIWKYDGTLDKYMGDGLMAFWGAPMFQEDHARRAVMAALEIQEELKKMRSIWKSHGMVTFSLGIGINTGTMIVGNMGASDFWDYTVLGDEVNLGSRIETLTRNYESDIIVSEATYRFVDGLVEGKKLGEVTVKGRENPVVIYSVKKLRERT
jgi:adenylate cyclase